MPKSAGRNNHQPCKTSRITLRQAFGRRSGRPWPHTARHAGSIRNGEPEALHSESRYSVLQQRNHAGRGWKRAHDQRSPRRKGHQHTQGKPCQRQPTISQGTLRRTNTGNRRGLCAQAGPSSSSSVSKKGTSPGTHPRTEDDDDATHTPPPFPHSTPPSGCSDADRTRGRPESGKVVERLSLLPSRSTLILTSRRESCGLFWSGVGKNYCKVTAAMGTGRALSLSLLSLRTHHGGKRTGHRRSWRRSPAPLSLFRFVASDSGFFFYS